MENKIKQLKLIVDGLTKIAEQKILEKADRNMCKADMEIAIVSLTKEVDSLKEEIKKLKAK